MITKTAFNDYAAELRAFYAEHSEEYSPGAFIEQILLDRRYNDYFVGMLLEMLGGKRDPWPGLTNTALREMIEARGLCKTEVYNRGLYGGGYRQGSDNASPLLKLRAVEHREWLTGPTLRPLKAIAEAKPKKDAVKSLQDLKAGLMAVSETLRKARDD